MLNYQKLKKFKNKLINKMMKLNLKSKFQSNIARKFNNLNIKSILAHKKDLLAVRKKSRN